jgi:hypothetical protein
MVSRDILRYGWIFVLLTSTLVWSQGVPRLTGVDPASGNVGDTLTLMGENLGNGSVVGFFLSDDETDFPAVVIEQTPDKTVLKIPEVEPGGYNISLQVENNIFIQPIRFTVE